MKIHEYGKKFWLVGVLLCGFYVSNAQKVAPYIRLGVGTGASPDFFEGIGMDVEGGIDYRGLQLSVGLTLFNSLPLGDTYQSISLQTHDDETIGICGMNNNLSGKRNVSAMVGIGYDLLRLIPDNVRHHLVPYFGIGWSSCTSLRAYHDALIGVGESDVTYGCFIQYDHASSFDYGFGARYEYSFSEKWGAGVAYKYFDLWEGDMLGFYVIYHF